MCAAPALLRAAQLNWILPTPEPRRPDGWSPRAVALAQSLVQRADRRPALLIGRLLNAVRSGGISKAKALLRGQEFRGSDEHEGEWLRQRPLRSGGPRRLHPAAGSPSSKARLSRRWVKASLCWKSGAGMTCVSA